MTRKLFIGLVAIAMVVGLTNTGRAPLAAAADVEWITFGVNVPLSGAGAAAYGIPPVRCAEMRAKEANDAGGITIGGKTYKFKIFAADNKYTVEGGRAFAEKLVYQEKGKYVCEVAGSGPCLGMQEVTEPAKVLTLYHVWTQKALGRQKPYSFRAAPLGDEISIPTMDAVKRKYPQAKTIAFIAPNAPHGRDNVASEMDLVPQYGWKPVAEEYYDMGTTDFYPIVTKIKAKKPEIVGLANTGPAVGALIMKALYEIGWRGIKFSAIGQHPKMIIDIAGAEACEGFLMAMGWDLYGAYATPQMREVADRYQGLHGEPLVYEGACAYLGADSIIKAMKKAVSIDTTMGRDRLAEMEWDSIFGPTHVGGEKRYGIKRVFVFPVVITEIRNGTPVDILKLNPDVP